MTEDSAYRPFHHLHTRAAYRAPYQRRGEVFLAPAIYTPFLYGNPAVHENVVPLEAVDVVDDPQETGPFV